MKSAAEWASEYENSKPVEFTDFILRVQADARAVPAGFVLVPVEPTEAMKRAGAPEIGPRLQFGMQYAQACYRAMIAAALSGRGETP